MEDREKNIRACLFRAQHRGSKEADLVIGAFAANCLENLSDEELSAFAELLTLDDQDIFTWLQCANDEGHPSSLKLKILHNMNQK
jgi:antitoxin CptB